jgi:hypothetical protein
MCRRFFQPSCLLTQRELRPNGSGDGAPCDLEMRDERLSPINSRGGVRAPLLPQPLPRIHGRDSSS